MAKKSEARQELFAREYVIDLNGSRAAIAAGYAESGAGVEACRLLKKPKVQKFIQDLQSKRASKLEVTQAKIAEEFARVGFANMLDYVSVTENGEGRIDLSTLSRDQAAAIIEISEDSTGGSGDGERKLIIRTKIKLADKLKALESLGRHLGMFQDNVKVTGLEGLAERMAALRKGDAGS